MLVITLLAPYLPPASTAILQPHRGWVHEASVAGRRMSEPMTSSIFDSFHLDRPYSRMYNTKHWGSNNRFVRQSKRDPLTFSSLFNLQQEGGGKNTNNNLATAQQESYTNKRYPRLTKYLTNQQTLLNNISDKLALLDMACKVKTCSLRLRRVIQLEKDRRFKRLARQIYQRYRNYF